MAQPPDDEANFYLALTIIVVHVVSMQEDIRLTALIELALKTSLSLDGLERQSRGLSSQDFAKWVGNVSTRPK